MVISMTGMLYRKYHGILILVFTLYPISVYWKPVLLLIVFITTLVYIPHLYWQYTLTWAAGKISLIDRTQRYTKSPIFFFLPVAAIYPFRLIRNSDLLCSVENQSWFRFWEITKMNIAGVLCFSLLFFFQEELKRTGQTFCQGCSFAWLMVNCKIIFVSYKIFSFLFIPTFFATYLFALSCFVFDILPPAGTFLPKFIIRN